MPFEKLIRGYKAFHANYFKSENKLFKSLVTEGQNPDTLLIGCSDSRADPAIMTNSEPGEMFVVRNVAALVPPYVTDSMHHGTSAALEFGVKTLKVKHIVVMGHSMCGGVGALAQHEITRDKYEFLPQWVEIGAPALSEIEAGMKDAKPEIRRRALEQAVVRVSMGNLMTFPWIAEAVEKGELDLHGWYFDMTTGKLSEYSTEKNVFVDLHAKGAKRAAR